MRKAARVLWCKRMLRKYKKGKCRRVWDVITGDETWIYYYDPRTKAQDTVWVKKGEQAPTKVRREKSTKKLMNSFFYEARPLELHCSASRTDSELVLLSASLFGENLCGVLENSAQDWLPRHAFASRQRFGPHSSQNRAVFGAKTRASGHPPSLLT